MDDSFNRSEQRSGCIVRGVDDEILFWIVSDVPTTPILTID
tara:strand:+ start:191 stop:313 length:123 start_codon:yes stop_codon:yes gene_type:complete